MLSSITDRRCVIAGAFLTLGLALAGPAAAQPSAEAFYRGKTITLLVGAAPGGAADTYARTFAPFFKKHMPGNPDVIIVNRPGAGGLAVASQLQNTSPRDGTVIASLQRNNFLAPLLSSVDTRFDPREVNHLGSLSRETYVIVGYGKNATVKSFQDALTKEIKLGGTGASAENVTYPLMANRYLGTKFNIIKGYTGNDEIELAIERGEVEGRAASYGSTGRSTLGRWREEGNLNFILQFGLEKEPALSNVPNVMDLVKDEEARALFKLILIPQEFGRPFAAPPGIPADRLAALRAAFVATANDPAFVAELAKQGATVELLEGGQLEQMARELFATPKSTVEKLKAVLSAT